MVNICAHLTSRGHRNRWRQYSLVLAQPALKLDDRLCTKKGILVSTLLVFSPQSSVPRMLITLQKTVHIGEPIAVITFFGGDDDRSDKPNDKASLVNPVTWAILKAVLFAHCRAQYLEHLDYMEYTETYLHYKLLNTSVS
jgi:hypothetical protein